MKIITQREAEELIEHLASRPDIWLHYVQEPRDLRPEAQHAREVWLRRIGPEDEFGLALSVRNGLPHDLCAISCKPVQWSEIASAAYLEWLLEKYTESYRLRRSIEKVLRAHHVAAQLDVLTREICEVL